MLTLQSNDPVAMAVVSAIQKGDVDGLKRLLAEHSGLAKARIVEASGAARSLLHVAADWPGHFANGAQTVRTLVAAGADVNASMSSTQPKHAETPLHWAASSNDIAVLDALLDGGADIEAPGAVFTDGSPMSDAVVFAQWDAARRLLERAALGQRSGKPRVWGCWIGCRSTSNGNMRCRRRKLRMPFDTRAEAANWKRPSTCWLAEPSLTASAMTKRLR